MDVGHKASKNHSDNANLGFQVIGLVLRIMQLNVEELSAAKRHIIQSLAEIHHIDVICPQQTHVNDDKSDHLTISGFDIISYTLHAKHVRSDVSDAAHVSSSPCCDVIQWADITLPTVLKLSHSATERCYGSFLEASRMLQNQHAHEIYTTYSHESVYVQHLPLRYNYTVNTLQLQLQVQSIC